MKWFYSPAAIVIGLTLFTGCATLAKLFPTPVPYSFVEEDSPSASIRFTGFDAKVSLVNFEGRTLPPPEKGTTWDAGLFFFPAGRTLDILVKAFWEDTEARSKEKTLLNTVFYPDKSVDKNIHFECPSLEAGKAYELSYVRESRLLTTTSVLVLVDRNAQKEIYRQEF